MIATETETRPHHDAGEAVTGLQPEALFILRPVGDAEGMALFALAAGRHVIGSAAACDIRLDVTGVEPRHCLIVTGPNRAVVRAYEPDTLLNGAAVTESPLSVGDILSVGPVELRLDSAESAVDSAAESGDEPAGQTESVAALLLDVQERFAVPDEAEARLNRWRDDLLRRENDLAIAIAAVRTAGARKPDRSSEPASSPAGVDGLAHMNRLRRRLAEMTAEITTAQADVLAREQALRERSEHLETWLATAAASEARCRDDERQIAADRERLREDTRAHEAREAELAQRTSSLDHRQAELDEVVADIAAREQAILEDANACKAARAQLAVDRAAITTQQEALRSDRDRLAKDRLELADERELLRLEVADLARHREDANAQIELALEELQSMEAMQRSTDETSNEVQATAESQRAAEIEMAWRERDFELREMELNWQRSELSEKAAELARREADRERDQVGFREFQAATLSEREHELERRERELDQLLTIFTEEQVARKHAPAVELATLEALGDPGQALSEWQARLAKDQHALSAVTEALTAERAALRAEESRFAAARREFAEEQERFAESVRIDLARRDAEAARAVAASSLEMLAAPTDADASDDAECVVDVAAPCPTEDASESLREFENALATLFDTGDDPSLRTDIIAADSNAGFWSPLEQVEAAIKVGGFELDDATNPDSIARYMQELLQRVREDNPLVPPAPEPDVDVLSEEAEVVRTASAVFCEPFELPVPRHPLDKDQLRAQTESLRDVANLSARSAIKQHSLRMRKAELFAKGVLTLLAIVIGGFLMAVYARFGSEYLWHLVAGFVTVLFVLYDFLMSFQRLAEAAKVETGTSVET